MIVAFGALPGLLFAAIVSGALLVSTHASDGASPALAIALLFTIMPCATALGCGIAAALRGGNDASEFSDARTRRSVRGACPAHLPAPLTWPPCSLGRLAHLPASPTIE